MTRAPVGIDSQVQLQPQTLERDFAQMGSPITRAISSPANVILFNASISKLSFAEPDPPRPIVEKFNPEIGITIVSACWKFFIAYHDISHVQASKNLPIGKYPVCFVGLVSRSARPTS